MSERDPRVDPVKGDVIRHPYYIGDLKIRYVVDGIVYSTLGAIGSLEYWRKWAAGATVVRKAGDAK